MTGLVDQMQELATHQTTEYKQYLGSVFTFVSPKGGTGKTLLSANTAYLFGKAGKRVVCVDADFSTRGLSLYV
jgi:Mrp family chromosome partitioning ATPase